jgi:salicylate hydroxylase
VPITVYEQAAHFAEIGAGVAFTGNAVQAMKICHEGIHQAFTKVRTSNVWPEKAKVWFDYHDGFHDKPDTHAFTISNELGQAGVHRAHYLDELVKLLPEKHAQFGKRLEKLERGSNGRWKMNFSDGSSAEADAVIGCDGIKSRVRQMMYGKDHPCAYPTYTHKYAYRALASMEDAIKAVGAEKAQNSCMHVSGGRKMWSTWQVLIDCRWVLEDTCSHSRLTMERF